ncbi:MAG: uL22 family ribosomal protein, partial [Actinomycetota bacterium]
HPLCLPDPSVGAVAKTLDSAIANAENNNGLKAENLVVREALALTAGRLKRFTPKARGSAGPIIKRNSHIKIILSDLQ